MSDSVQPNGRQPTRLPRPWDSPGKNTGVGCHFLLQCVKVKSLSRVRLQATPWTAAFQAPPSMGFSRQEYWSEVPLPSPTHSHFPCFPTGEHLSYCKYQYGQFSKGGRLLFPASQVFRSQWFWLMSWEQKLLSRISAKLLKSGKQGLPRWSNS